jgi:hypothetical protein
MSSLPPFFSMFLQRFYEDIGTRLGNWASCNTDWQSSIESPTFDNYLSSKCRYGYFLTRLIITFQNKLSTSTLYLYLVTIAIGSQWFLKTRPKPCPVKFKPCFAYSTYRIRSRRRLYRIRIQSTFMRIQNTHHILVYTYQRNCICFIIHSTLHAQDFRVANAYDVHIQ